MNVGRVSDAAFCALTRSDSVFKIVAAGEARARGWCLGARVGQVGQRDNPLSPFTKGE